MRGNTDTATLKSAAIFQIKNDVNSNVITSQTLEPQTMRGALAIHGEIAERNHI